MMPADSSVRCTPIVYKLLSCLFNFFLIQSPILVMHNSVTTRKTPGIRIIHQAPVSSAFSDSDSILPHEITSSGSPIPMKLNVDSSTIALRMFMTTIPVPCRLPCQIRLQYRQISQLLHFRLPADTHSRIDPLIKNLCSHITGNDYDP